MKQPHPNKPAVSPLTYDDPEYDADDCEFMRAVEAYKKRTGRRFPSNCELLGIAKSLGYRKVAPAPGE